MNSTHLDQPLILRSLEYFFSSNVAPEIQLAISSELGIFNLLNTRRYLGLLSLIGRSNKAGFAHLKDRLWGRIQTRLNKPHLKAGREVLIKSVNQAIPSYYMSVFLLPISTTDELQKMINSFWWGTKKDGSSGINWLS